MYHDNKVYLLSHPLLKLPKERLNYYRQLGLGIIEIDTLEEMPDDADFWYWTRKQLERYKDEDGNYSPGYEALAEAGEFIVDNALLAQKKRPYGINASSAKKR